jgi:transcriptional regulator with XRE-family HTH domain
LTEISDDYYSDEAATFGDRLAAAREAIGFSQSQLAARAGVRLSTIQNWESDRAEPRANKLQMIAGILNVSIVWLLTGAGQGGVPPEPAEAQEFRGALAELREIRVAQTRLLARLARLEKRLRERGTG